jgi:hypothetical protein
MAFDVNSFVIDRILRGIMVSSVDGSYLWGVNQITNPTLSITTETDEAVDALGVTIATFNRSKAASFSGENSLFDLGLYAAQAGREKEIATETKKLVAPAFETIDVTSEGTVTLAHTPTADITEIYVLNGDGSLGEKYTSAAEASATEFIYADGKITLPTGIKAGSQIFVIYEYETSEAVQVVHDAVSFPKAGKFVLDVLGTDVCDPETLIHAYIVFPKGKLDAAVDVDFTTDTTHPFTINAQQDYCDSEKQLFKIIIPKED